ncbi:carboxylating nicotinate-nucleotide diphosphorylase [Alphaproteobacteria bacterium]|nr:carboxylating nicotinate-nucleotide diphosphorylase [Alphaproteobacteria bacterium]
MSQPLTPLSTLLVEQLVHAALQEDWGRSGDVTAQAVIPHDAQAHAIIRAREPGVVAGLQFANAAFTAAASGLVLQAHKTDGARIEAGEDIAIITGPAQALLASERVALNFMGHLSGVASQTAKLVDLVAHTSAKICDTRKTTPGLRAAEKYAVRAGGGANHRFGLDDAILIKDNHIAVAGGVTAALRAAQKAAGHMLAIEIEVDTLEQLDEALAAEARIILLDNMSPSQLAEAVARNEGRAVLEASGRVNADSVTAIAESGVDYISVGAITHSAAVLDFGLDIDVT